jgi:hypothetical protein
MTEGTRFIGMFPAHDYTSMDTLLASIFMTIDVN